MLVVVTVFIPMYVCVKVAFSICVEKTPAHSAGLLLLFIGIWYIFLVRTSSVYILVVRTTLVYGTERCDHIAYNNWKEPYFGVAKVQLVRTLNTIVISAKFADVRAAKRSCRCHI